MPKFYYGIFVTLILAIGIIGVLTGEVKWSGFIGGVAFFTFSEWLRRSSKNRNSDGEVEYDERVNSNIIQFGANTLFISFSLLLTYLVVSKYVLEQPFIKVEYILFYIIATLYVALFLAPTIIKEK